MRANTKDVAKKKTKYFVWSLKKMCTTDVMPP